MSEQTTEQQPDPQLTVDPVEVPQADKPAEQMVSKAEFDKVMADMHRYKTQARELATASNAEQEKLLREGKRWEELAELKAREAEEAKTESQRLKNAIVDDKKFSAVREAAVKAGIRPEAIADLEMIGLDKIEVETTDLGRVNVLGVDSLIGNIKLSRPHWFGGGRTSVAGSVPNVSSPGLVSLAEINKLSLEAQKSGDYTAYSQKIKQYQQQKKGV